MGRLRSLPQDQYARGGNNTDRDAREMSGMAESGVTGTLPRYSNPDYLASRKRQDEGRLLECKAPGKSRNPLDTGGNTRGTLVTSLQTAAGPKGQTGRCPAHRVQTGRGHDHSR